MRSHHSPSLSYPQHHRQRWAPPKIFCCVFVVVSTSNNNNVDGWILDLPVCHILFCELSSFLCHATHIREQERKMLRAFNIVRCCVYYPLQWSMKAINWVERLKTEEGGDFVLKYSSKKAFGEWGNLHHLSPSSSTHVCDARAIKAKTSKMTRRSESVVTILEWMPADFEFSKLHFYDLLFSARLPIHSHWLIGIDRVRYEHKRSEMVTEWRKTLKLACKDSCSSGGKRKALEPTHETLFCSASPAIFNNFTANGDIFHHIRAREKRGHPKCLLQLKLKIIYCSQKKEKQEKLAEGTRETFHDDFEWMEASSHSLWWGFICSRETRSIFKSQRARQAEESTRSSESMWRVVGEKYSRVVESASSKKKLLLTLAQPPSINSMTWKDWMCHTLLPSAHEKCFIPVRRSLRARACACWDFLYFF